MLNPALEFCMSACVTEMRGDYNFEKRCNNDSTPGLAKRTWKSFMTIFSSRAQVTISLQNTLNVLL